MLENLVLLKAGDLVLGELDREDVDAERGEEG